MTEKTEVFIVKKTFLGWEDHGIFTFNLELEGDRCSTTVGNYVLEGPEVSSFLQSILTITSRDQWERIPGSYVRVYSKGLLSVGFGHVMKDLWFSVDKDEGKAYAVPFAEFLERLERE